MPAHPPFEFDLKDGTRVRLRPVTAADKARLQKGLSLLSEASRYLRFFAPIQYLSEQELRYFTEVDQIDHVAWGADDPDNPDFPGFGIARYIRLKEDPSVAEFAVTVIDEYQRRGLGTILVALLYLIAQENGIDRFRGTVHPQNRILLNWFRKLGATTKYVDGVMVAELSVASDSPHTDNPSSERFRKTIEQIRHSWQARSG